MAKILVKGEAPSGRPPLVPHITNHRRKRLWLNKNMPHHYQVVIFDHRLEVVGVKELALKKVRLRCDISQSLFTKGEKLYGVTTMVPTNCDL